MHKILFFCLTVLAVGTLGCGSSSEQPAETVTVVERTVVEKPAPAPSSAPADPEPAPRETSRIRVPDVVGMNHQYAQDKMQSVGLYMLDEEDATGQGRMLTWDRNWVVVEQEPPAGTMVTEETTIMLRSKKDGE
jgi:chitodextrinase